MTDDTEQSPSSNLNRLRRVADQVEAELDVHRKAIIRLKVENEALRQKHHKLRCALSDVEKFFFLRPFTRGRAKQLALIRSALEWAKL